MFKANDIMTRTVITVCPEMPIYDAVRIFTDRNITGLPVVDANLNLIGLLNEKDVLKTMYATEDSPDKSVADFMTTDFISFDENATLIDLCDCFVEKDLRRVPVMENGRLAGIVSVSNVISAILKFKHQSVEN
ncbi:MAG: CBS domain-containing protein [Planctomycetota bacterium]|jgi:CBS domain-containing protein